MRDDHLCLQMGVAIKSKQIELSDERTADGWCWKPSSRWCMRCLASDFYAINVRNGEGGRVPPVAHYQGWIEQSSSRGAMIKSLAPTIYERRLVAPKERRGPPKEEKKIHDDILLPLSTIISEQETRGFFSTMRRRRDPLRGKVSRHNVKLK